MKTQGKRAGKTRRAARARPSTPLHGSQSNPREPLLAMEAVLGELSQFVRNSCVWCGVVCRKETRLTKHPRVGICRRARFNGAELSPDVGNVAEWSLFRASGANPRFYVTFRPPAEGAPVDTNVSKWKVAASALVNGRKTAVVEEVVPQPSPRNVAVRCVISAPVKAREGAQLLPRRRARRMVTR
jgi:hypothetical protein